MPQHEVPVIRLVDDNASFLESLSFMLIAEGWRTRSYASAHDFLREDDLKAPGCIVLDVQMPGLTGLQLQQRLNERGVRLPIIFLTAHGDIDMAVGALHDGACDFQSKPVNPVKLLASVARAVHKSLEGDAEDIMNALSRYDSLSAREERILRSVAAGLTSRTIALAQGLSKFTVDHYRADGMRKTGLSDPARLASFFARIDAWREAHPQQSRRAALKEENEPCQEI